MKRRAFIFTAILVLLSNVGVLAAPIDARYDSDAFIITVSGDLGKEFANKRVLLYCIKSGDDSILPEEINTEYASDYYKLFRQSKTDSNGGYRFDDLGIKAERGDCYDFILTVENSDERFLIDSFYIPSSSEITAFLSDVSSHTGDEVYRMLENEASSGSIGVDTTLYQLLSPSGRKGAAKKIAGNLFSNVSELSLALSTASAENTPVYAGSAEEADRILFPEDDETLSSYAELLNAQNGYDTFKSANLELAHALENMTPTERIPILDKALSFSPNTVSGFYDKLSISCILYEIKNVSGYGDLAALLKRYSTSTLRKLDYPAYSACKYKNDINDELLKRSFDSVQDLCIYVNEAVVKYNNKTASASGGGGGGGGSSSLGTAPVGGEVQTPVPSVPPITELDVFTDLDGFLWAKDAIVSLYQKGIVSGVGESRFQPERAVLREEFVKMLLLSNGVTIRSGAIALNDVDHEAWYAPYVYTAINENIAKGISASEFGIGLPITREDAAVLIWRMHKEPIAEHNEGFFDEADISEYAVDAVRWMKAEGLLSGYPDGTFRPENPITRAESAKLLHSLISAKSR